MRQFGYCVQNMFLSGVLEGRCSRRAEALKKRKIKLCLKFHQHQILPMSWQAIGLKIEALKVWSLNEWIRKFNDVNQTKISYNHTFLYFFLCLNDQEIRNLSPQRNRLDCPPSKYSPSPRLLSPIWKQRQNRGNPIHRTRG